MRIASYRNSHTAKDKGVSYDAHYTRDSHSRLLWTLEQTFLTEFLAGRFPHHDIHLLDFACGTGRITQFLESRVGTCVGLDVSSPMLERAARKLQHTRLIQADLTTGNVLAGQKFNLITAFRFFLNAEPPLRKVIMRILASLLADDGYLVFNIHNNRTTPWALLGHIRSRCRADRAPYNVMSAQEMRNLATTAGLHVVCLPHLGVLPPPFVRRMPKAWAHCIEASAMRARWLAPFSQELIAVCRHRGG